MKKEPERGPSASQLRDGFIARFDPPIAKLLRQARSVLAKHFATAVELVYDNYNALAIGWAPNERATEVIVSLAGYARGVSLYFTHGAKLDDPHGLLEGNGNQGRYIRLESVQQLSDDRVQALLDAAVAHGQTPLPREGEKPHRYQVDLGKAKASQREPLDADAMPSQYAAELAIAPDAAHRSRSVDLRLIARRR